MEYRITTTETILRQYVVTAETQADALDIYNGAGVGVYCQHLGPCRCWTEAQPRRIPGTKQLVPEDGPVTTHPERMVHIEEEPEELIRQEREGSEYEPLNWPQAHCPVCQVPEGTRCRHPNGYTCAQPHAGRPQ